METFRLSLPAIVGRSLKGTRVGILCFSAIPDDPRVRRQGDIFDAQGWSVTAIGLPGARSALPGWNFIAVGEAPAANAPPASPAPAASAPAGNYDVSPGKARHLRRIAKFGVHQFYRARRVLDIVRGYFQPSHAARTYWKLNLWFKRIYDEAKRHEVDIWIANDWTTLPIAMRLAAEQGVPYVYDTHEFASDEYGHRLFWRIATKPIIASIERAGLKGAAVCTCVSEGISAGLQSAYGLGSAPLVIRNTPAYSEQPFRPTGERIEVLYHGVVAEGRGLEECIRSVSLWRPEFRLTIRGPAVAGYREALERLAAEAGVAGRVVFAEPVPMTELVRRAAEFDVGLFALPGHSLQNVHVLPNKFFEYAMAGLALCVSDTPEMKRLLQRHDLGQLIDGMAPEAIAASVNSLDRATIDQYKRNALAAARELNWDNEGKTFVKAVAAALASRDFAA